MLFATEEILPHGQDDGLVKICHPAVISSSGKAKASVVVAVVRLVPVAIGRTRVAAVVDPAAAAQNTVLALLQPSPQVFTIDGLPLPVKHPALDAGAGFLYATPGSGHGQ